MLAIVRGIIVILFTILIVTFGCIYCLFSPRNPRHVMTFGHAFGKLHKILGIKLLERIPAEARQFGPSIYVGNHQNNYDMVTMSNAVQPRTVTVGKKSLVFIPFFGQLYWMTGNILIDRENRTKAHGTISQVVDQIKKHKISVWMFPEGTRSRGRGLLPFKTGAFHAAIAAGVPIVPVCVSSTHQKIKLNRWNNGAVIVEMLPPIDTTKYTKEQVRELAEHCRQMMQAKIEALDKEVEALNKRK
ncbi:1-acylglycerol-3-phosphate O-acyltransferase [Xenorhabdus nematophila]|uniref:1-acyl-sn-glycerol-3-phosphate acyltransferase n=1 Tax=Xenorhabdus nematophila (strain ATCC 19061 / DSM 3370 / CCUG 14189 / LMG 1036 / NCIMB 9965 / AN6) TaxID=406817 RepID=D3VCR1_XENNA|nr:1-acylglycerol-3-phosphate O-acyltransferase [Xenorhabdus nematophila]CEE91400.1 1-acyl-sn-glycerol-3-phosphate acyltransferase [Xenorhabdus nematophila str. Anatoliense]CEF33071.1 1-acyl-sn-glycerol-3-phosphate acyltransferase [Xenorhabdus nematophila str. Websteri]AYA42099.1 1-acylglycerol-3-phosphate O-acyltransferase [Xenorhabdus nematophila]KHD28835.1 acyl-phosphate glycerol 3-phosphate acyltransferase [Xenorhabdus nematophila]MBA0020821.1 1-acylglycerol-3-phosphate O-acyltransferase [